MRTAGHRYRSSAGLRLARAAAQGNGRAKVRAVNGKLHSPGWGPAARRVCRHRRGKGNRLSEGRWVNRRRHRRGRAVLVDCLGNSGVSAGVVSIALVIGLDGMRPDTEGRGSELGLSAIVQANSAAEIHVIHQELDGPGRCGRSRRIRRHGRREGHALAKHRGTLRRSHSRCRRPLRHYNKLVRIAARAGCAGVVRIAAIARNPLIGPGRRRRKGGGGIVAVAADWLRRGEDRCAAAGAIARPEEIEGHRPSRTGSSDGSGVGNGVTQADSSRGLGANRGRYLIDGDGEGGRIEDAGRVRGAHDDTRVSADCRRSP